MLKLNLDIKETDAKGEKWHDAPWTGKFVKKYQMHFKSGSTKPQVGETLTGASSGTTAKVASVSVCSGSWSGGDAAGTITFTSAGSDEFESGEQINGSVGGNNMLTCVSSVYAGYGLLHPMSNMTKRDGKWWTSELYNWYYRKRDESDMDIDISETERGKEEL